MSTEGFKLQASIKDTDGDMVNFRADSAEELADYLAGFPYDVYAQAKANLRGASAVGSIAQPSTPTAAPVAAPAPTPAPQNNGWGQPPVAQAAPVAAGGPVNGTPHPEGKVCGGCATPIQFKSFTAKSGKAMRMWTCPNQRSKDDGHFSEFIWDNWSASDRRVGGSHAAALAVAAPINCDP